MKNYLYRCHGYNKLSLELLENLIETLVLVLTRDGITTERRNFKRNNNF